MGQKRHESTIYHARVEAAQTRILRLNSGDYDSAERVSDRGDVYGSRASSAEAIAFRVLSDYLGDDKRAHELAGDFQFRIAAWAARKWWRLSGTAIDEWIEHRESGFLPCEFAGCTVRGPRSGLIIVGSRLFCAAHAPIAARG